MKKLRVEVILNNEIKKRSRRDEHDAEAKNGQHALMPLGVLHTEEWLLYQYIQLVCCALFVADSLRSFKDDLLQGNWHTQSAHGGKTV